MGNQSSGKVNWGGLIGWGLFGGAMLWTLVTASTNRPEPDRGYTADHEQLPAISNPIVFNQQHYQSLIGSNQRLKDIESFEVDIRISEEIFSNPSTILVDLRNRVELGLRRIGVKVVQDQADALLDVSVTGFWDNGHNLSVFMVYISVHEEGLCDRNGSLYVVSTSPWTTSRVCAAGRNKFNESFSYNLDSALNEFCNDYLTANQE